MTRKMLCLTSALLACGLVPQVFAATSTALDAYLAGVRTLRAEFTQQVHSQIAAVRPLVQTLNLRVE